MQRFKLDWCIKPTVSITVPHQNELNQINEK